MNASADPRSRRAAQRKLPSVATVLGLFLSAFGLSSCHKATEADCEQILDRIVELELRDQGVTDPELVKRRTDETKARKREQLIKTCVGKRVSQSNMECIRKAQTAAEITDKCLR
jgi:hypothetical protein